MTTLPPEGNQNPEGHQSPGLPPQQPGQQQPQQPPQQPQYQQQPPPQQPQYQQQQYQQQPQAPADPLNTVVLNYWLSVFFTWITGLIFWLMEKDKGNVKAADYHRENFNFAL